MGSFLRSLNLIHGLLVIVALGPPTTALGQGVIHAPSAVSFQNTETTVQGVDSHLVTNVDNTLLIGSKYKAELYYLDTDTGILTAMPGTISSFKASTTSKPGTWTGPATPVSLPNGYGGVDEWDDGTGEVGNGSGTGPGYYPVTLAVRAWDSTTGTSWEVATVRGESPPFLYTQRFHLLWEIQMVTQPGFQLQAAPVAPGIAVQPAGQSGYWGKSASFSVAAYGSQPLSYQWFKDGSSIDGANQNILTLTDLSLSAGGNYSVVIGNSVNSVTSNPALLILNAASISIVLSPINAMDSNIYPGISIDGVVGKTYGVQSTTNLAHSSSWVPLTTVTLTNPVQLWVDTNADAMGGTAPRRTYRVVAVP